jgi:hypothetical protein
MKEKFYWVIVYMLNLGSSRLEHDGPWYIYRYKIESWEWNIFPSIPFREKIWTLSVGLHTI